MTDLDFDTSGSLPGTVKYYHQHLIVCSGHSGWSMHFEEGDPFSIALTAAVKTAQPPRRTKISACSATSQSGGTDLLWFPEGQRILGLRESDLPAVIRLLRGEGDAGLRLEPVEEAVFLICCNFNRDQRCGTRGPQVYGALLAYLAAQNLAGQAQVYHSSHLGGHRFAGVLLCYPSGNWYGRVTPQEVPALVQAELNPDLQAGSPVKHLWRGRMGMTVPDQIAYSQEV